MKAARTFALSLMAHSAVASFDMWTQTVVAPGEAGSQRMIFSNFQTGGNCDCLGTASGPNVYNLPGYPDSGSGKSADVCYGSACDIFTAGPDNLVLDSYRIRNTAFGGARTQIFEYWNEIYIEGTGGGSYAMYADNYDNNQYRIRVGGCRAATGPSHLCFAITPDEYYKLLECEGDVNFVPGEGGC